MSEFGQRSDVRTDAEQKAAEMKANARAAGEELKRTVGEKVDSAKAEASRQGEELFQEGRSRASGELEGYRKALERAAESLEEESKTGPSSILHQAADILGRTQNRLHQKDLKGMARDAEDLVRQNPEVACGALFVLGLATSRFLKASSSRHDEERDRSGRRPTFGDYRSQPAYPYVGAASTDAENREFLAQPGRNPSNPMENQNLEK